MYETLKHSPVQRPSVQRHSWLDLERIVQALELIQDGIVICLCLGLFSFMVLQIREMVLSLIPPVQFHAVTADILSLLIWVELFRLLIIYLKEQRISIGVAVEVAIVSVLREVIVRGVLETNSTQILATCAFLPEPRTVPLISNYGGVVRCGNLFPDISRNHRTICKQ